MPPSKLIVWVCGDCSARNDGSEPGPCVLCDAPQPKRRAVAVDSSVPAASAAVASLVSAKFVPKCRPVGATHPSGLVLDIVGIAAGDWDAVVRITWCAAVSCLRRTLLYASARRGSLSQTSLLGRGRNGIGMRRPLLTERTGPYPQQAQLC